MTDWRCRVAALVAAGALLASGCVASVAFADEPVAPAAGTDCEAVADWDTLRSCLTTETAGSVTITAPITAEDGTITVAGAKTLSATDGNGVFGAEGATRPGPVFEVPAGASLTIENGTYSGLHASTGGDSGANGSLIHASGTVTVNDGTFKGNSARNGGVIFQEAGSLNVTGGTFKDNTATAGNGDNPANGKGGGVLYAKGDVTISGGSFTGNASTGAGRAVGGGAVHMDAGQLTISGGKFQGNHTESGSYMSGGGAVYVKGGLTVSNENGTPEFDGNWAAGVGSYPSSDVKIGAGGAGGAIFLQTNPSMSYILGGSYTGNVSGYLGGAIYTEEGTTTYVGPAVAFGNTAGHFGGGLWFCPSGNANASKGGNIALFDNTVDSGIDANTENLDPSDGGTYAGGPTEAGDDLAIMNPHYKSRWGQVTYNAFDLLDTWFTDRNEPAVDWYWDGRPMTEANGYSDSVQDPNAQTENNEWNGHNLKSFAVRAYKNDGSDKPTALKDATTKRYSTTGEGNVRQEPGTLEQAWNNRGHANTYGGIALKSVPKSDGLKDQAKSGAKISISGNRARLSGGGFGSNGRVVFATPYTAAWEKVDADNHATHLGGSVWKITTTDGGAFSPQMGVDAGCPADETTDGTNIAEDCWAKRDGTDGPKSIVVADYVASEKDADRGGRDNNPDAGYLSIDNLSPGTYTLTEIQAPGGFETNKTSYQFNIVKGQTKTPDITYANGSGDGSIVAGGMITNKRQPGLVWSKTETGSNTLLGGSEWTITKQGDDKPLLTVKDCEPDVNKGSCDGTNDSDSDKGKFKVDNLGAGSYTLKETKAPAGHWLDATEYSFTIEAGNENVQLKVGDTVMDTNEIRNKPTEVSWLKVGIDNQNTPLAGSVWTLKRTDSQAGIQTVYESITDCAPDQNSNSRTCDDVDQDGEAGKFRLAGLEAGTYQLTETTAPDGYVKSEKTYTFTISQEEPDGGIVPISIEGETASLDGNKIVNAKSVSALPLTGGRSALDWAMTGGMLAILAGGVAVVADRLRRRAGAR